MPCGGQLLQSGRGHRLPPSFFVRGPRPGAGRPRRPRTARRPRAARGVGEQPRK
ncbi:hypothetical protein SLNWT_3334 [Streptomyces albus]|uniref:Uncharacterized protein n=1 Tax=Streptomyces albus (strain ATCC 21838 / DSM 41398 / FERM P-419 / JCM 4703 / NBRC 107858) TaxID=1081613 RepID=A0A0B5EWX6_STRA4|nr:hypothetical protein SLNWT_3334 [Streptomyces albus]AOU78017.1 hypothetical protein SLNHY_3326 [Streptomyces albus]AYN33771.1 hypothetical protein DUI70_3271 [Streptomyces albus]